MSEVTVGLIGIAVLFVLLFSRMPVGFVMALVGVAGFMYLRSVEAGFTILQTVPYCTTHSYTLTVIPLFILMGNFCFWAGLSRDAYDASYKWLGHMPGGLASSTVGACATFAAVSGTSTGTLATMGTVALPEMLRHKYDPRLAIGSICCGGTIGILIPPSTGLIVYAIITEVSIGKLFIAGILPGLLEAIFYMLTIYILCKRNPLMGPPGPSTTWREKLGALKGTWGILVLFLLVIGGIYAGIFTPTEAGGIGALGALLLALGRRRLTRQGFITALLDSGKLTVMILILLIGAYIFGYFLTVTQIPMTLASVLGEASVSRYVILGGVLFIYLVLGCFLDVYAMMLLTLPTFFPVIVALGFDPIWFGVICVRMMEIGMITPPVGLNLFIAKGVAKDIPLGTIIRGVVPFLIADIVNVVILILIPQITLFLPSMMK